QPLKFLCFGNRDKSCSDHFVLNAASVSVEFVPDCSCIYFKVLIYFIHDSITLTSSEYDISSDGALWITSSHEACTVGNPCSHARKGVSYPSQCAFAYHKFIKMEFNIVYERNEILAADGTHCVSYGSDVLPYHALITQAPGVASGYA
ncbi:hypothetical protein T03_245, partial [Trichinella britovi]